MFFSVWFKKMLLSFKNLISETTVSVLFVTILIKTCHSFKFTKLVVQNLKICFTLSCCLCEPLYTDRLFIFVLKSASD